MPIFRGKSYFCSEFQYLIFLLPYPTYMTNSVQTVQCRAAAIQAELETYINPVKREYLPKFFKTGPGQYGEGDRFLGVVVPDTRRVAKLHKDEPLPVCAVLLESPWHECRLCALLMLVERFRKASGEERKSIFHFYLAHTSRINNWDLVDLSAPYIVGEYLVDKPREVLVTLAASSLLWERRIAVVSTLAFIRRGDFADILSLCTFFLEHEGYVLRPGARRKSSSMHDLMQKALGWMLRETGKRDKTVLTAFLDASCTKMPRTMLRYAVERLSPEERRQYMGQGSAES